MGFYSERVFPRLLAASSPGFDEERRRLLAEARGRVLELGVGTGASLGFYGPDVREVVGIDPNAGVLGKARERLERLRRADPSAVPHAVTLMEGDAQRLPFGDGSFDTVVAFLTLCSVTDAGAAAREAARVLNPEGRLLVYEHVAAERGSALRWWQHRLNPLWRKAAVGCNLDRPTEEVLAMAAFDTHPLERYRERTVFPPVAPRIRGVLRKL